MSFSFAVTAYNELSEEGRHGDFILRCIRPAQEHPAIDEIVVVDDSPSDEGLGAFLDGQAKVQFFRNPQNLGVFGNKLEAVARCRGDWVINCDSDNFMDRAYLDSVIAHAQLGDTWISASFARPEFDYRGLTGLWSRENLRELLSRPRAGCLLNTGNQTVYRPAFMELFERVRGLRPDLLMPNWLNIPDDQRPAHHWRLVFDALDSTIYNMIWLRAGNRIRVVEGLEYDHHYSSGADSNYSRAPRDKDRLSDVLLRELEQLAR